MTDHPVLLVARREVRVLTRSRAAVGAAALLAAVAWLPALLLPLRRGALGLAGFPELLPLAIALAAVVLPLLALLAGAELLAGEIEDGSLVSALTLPLSRRACFAGKCLGRAATLGVAYVVAFASAGIGVTLARGAEGAASWTAVAAAGLCLSLSTGAVGAAVGAGGRGRVKAFGVALVAWIGLVFALDAVLLTAIVALAPPPPGAVGAHGHGELAAPGSAHATPGDDPHARQGEARSPAPGSASRWLLAASPVGLFRLTSLAASAELRPGVGLDLPGERGAALWAPLGAGWLVWVALPLFLGLRRFERVDLV